MVLHRRKKRRSKKLRRRKRRVAKRTLKEEDTSSRKRGFNPVRFTGYIPKKASKKPSGKSFKRTNHAPEINYLKRVLDLHYVIRSRECLRDTRRLRDLLFNVVALLQLLEKNPYLRCSQSGRRIWRQIKDLVFSISFISYWDDKKDWIRGPQGLPRWLRRRYSRVALRLRDTRTVKLYNSYREELEVLLEDQKLDS